MDETINDGITPELIAEILTYVKRMKGIKDTSQDELLSTYILMICKNILIRTRRDKFPTQLKYVVVDLVCDKMLANEPDEDVKSIQSMSEYDRSVNFGVSETVKAKLQLLAEQQIDANLHLIFEYRLLYRT